MSNHEVHWWSFNLIKFVKVLIHLSQAPNKCKWCLSRFSLKWRKMRQFQYSKWNLITSNYVKISHCGLSEIWVIFFCLNPVWRIFNTNWWRWRRFFLWWLNASWWSTFSSFWITRNSSLRISQILIFEKYGAN